MDEQRFDDLSKKLATSVSRRQAVRILGATAVGGLGALFGARGASANHNANCRGTGDNCRSNAECCSGVCLEFHCQCPGGTVLCPGTGECVQACFGQTVFNPETCQCECPPGTSLCGEFVCCVDNFESCCDGIFCCPEGTDCCAGLGFCCPTGSICDPGFGCVFQCTTPGFQCNDNNDCGPGCVCNTPFPGFPGFCE